MQNTNESSIEQLIKKADTIDQKLDKIIDILNNNIGKNTEKMANHIDFIERIYNNVKSPLGFLCNKINYLKGNDTEKYSLEYKTDKTDSQ
tara:strand:+ start:9205 stop:9474 length:270 start_codon:yes stop_codon:yes gene_type:complete